MRILLSQIQSSIRGGNIRHQRSIQDMSNYLDQLVAKVKQAKGQSFQFVDISKSAADTYYAEFAYDDRITQLTKRYHGRFELKEESGRFQLHFVPIKKQNLFGRILKSNETIYRAKPKDVNAVSKLLTIHIEQGDNTPLFIHAYPDSLAQLHTSVFLQISSLLKRHQYELTQGKAPDGYTALILQPK